MLGVQAAVLAITCFVVVVMLLTSPWWMRALTVVVSAVWKQIARTDDDVVMSNLPKDIVEGDFREVDK